MFSKLVEEFSEFNKEVSNILKNMWNNSVLYVKSVSDLIDEVTGLI